MKVIENMLPKNHSKLNVNLKYTFKVEKTATTIAHTSYEIPVVVV